MMMLLQNIFIYFGALSEGHEICTLIPMFINNKLRKSKKNELSL